MFDILNGSADVRRVLSTESVEQIICQPRELTAIVSAASRILWVFVCMVEINGVGSLTCNCVTIIAQNRNYHVVDCPMSELWLFRTGVEALFQFRQKFVQIALRFRLVSERTDFLTCVGLVIPEIVQTVNLCLLILGSSLVHLHRCQLFHVILPCK
jgi:hypothetical protein